MSANVRCTREFIAAEGSRCSWKSERLPAVPNASFMPDTAVQEVFAQKATTKPCPRCGSRVELIPDPEPSP